MTRHTFWDKIPHEFQIMARTAHGGDSLAFHAKHLADEGLSVDGIAEGIDRHGRGGREVSEDDGFLTFWVAGEFEDNIGHYHYSVCMNACL